MDIKNANGDVLMTLEQETFESVDFYKKELPEADFREAQLQGIRFYKANLQKANFQGANLRKADLQVANLQGANLRQADLSYANLLDTDLRGADLTEASLKWTVLKGTKYDSKTKFPTGFSPKQYEMIFFNEVPVSA